MRALLDTHTFIWWLSDNPALTARARYVIVDTRNEIFVSAASGWEIATKVRLGKLPTASNLAADFSSSIQNEGFQIMAISGDHAVRAGLLPGSHKDPFDRMLIAQSQAENMPLLSNEVIFDTYGVRRIW
jgi:PIN domain nuclease of toxin-antitoxin system